MITYDSFKVDLFSTKICCLKLDGINLNKLRQECYEYKKTNSSREVTNEGGWQSNDIIYSEIDKQKYSEYILLVDIIENILLSFSKNINCNPLVIDNIWININGHNHFNWSHIHGNSIISGAFYIQVPTDTDSQLVFEHKNENLSMWYSYMSKSSIKDSSTAFSKSFSPEENNLFLFPSYIWHKVTPNKSYQDRISIAFNTVELL